MKNLYTIIKKSKITTAFLSCLLLFATTSYAQYQTVEIGTGDTYTDNSIPIEPYWGYTYSQQIYTAAELTAAGMQAGSEVKNLIFEYNSSDLLSSDEWDVFIGPTSKSSFTGYKDWEKGLLPYFSGTVTVTLGSPNTVVVAGNMTPFTWDGVSNIIIAVDENAPGYGDYSQDFYCRYTSDYRYITYYDDNTNPDPNLPPVATTYNYYVPNLYITANNIGGGGGGCSGSHSTPTDLSANNVSGSVGTSFCAPNVTISTFPYTESFGSTIGCEWCFNSTSTNGRINSTLSLNGDNVLMMDCNPSGYVENTATLSLDLSGETGKNILLNFNRSDHSDEYHTYDRVQFSPNGGTNWYTCVSVLGSNSSIQAAYPQVDLSLQLGFSYSSNFLIKWSQYDNVAYAADGIAIDDISIVSQTTGTAGLWTGASSTAWNNTSNWDDGNLPTSAVAVTIPSGTTYSPYVNISNAVCAALTVESGGTLYCAGSSYKLTASTVTIDNGGTISISAGEIESTGKMDWDGNVTMSGGILDVNNEIELSSTTTESISGGTIYCQGSGSYAWDGYYCSSFTPTGGTVHFDSQTDTDRYIDFGSYTNCYFNNVQITGDVKQYAHIRVKGDITINNQYDWDISSYYLYLEGDLITNGTGTTSYSTANGKFWATSSGSLQLEGSANQSIGSFNDGGIYFYVNKTGGTVTQNGYIKVKHFYLGTSSSSTQSGTYLIDNESFVTSNHNYLYSGKLQVTGGMHHINSNKNMYIYDGGELDVDGGELRLGNMTSNKTAGMFINGGDVDVSGGTLNIADEINLSYTYTTGSITQSGGTINLGKNTNTGNGATIRLYLGKGQVNLTGGTINIYGQHSNSSNRALYVQTTSVLTVNATNNHTITFNNGLSSSDENLAYYCPAGQKLGNVTVNCSGYSLTQTYNGTDIGGDLTITAGTYNKASLNLDLSGSFINNSGTFTTTGGTITFDGAGDVTCDAISNTATILYVSKTSSGKVTTTGNLSLDDVYITAGTFDVGTSSTVTASGTTDINGTLSSTGGTYVANGSTDIDGTLSGTGTYDANGVFDATNGAISLTGTGRLQLSSTVTSLGALSTSAGTVEYDGGTQTVKQDSYYDLEIDQSGVKTMSAANTVYGDLTINSGATLTSSSNYGDITLNGGSFINNGTYNINTSEMSFTGGNNVTCGAISGSNTGNLVITKSSSSNTVTTTGNLDLNSFTVNEGTLVVDGETVTHDFTSNIYAGATLQIKSGLVYYNYITSNSLNVNGGTLDMDGGELRIGSLATSSGFPDLQVINSGTLDISGGTVNIEDELEVSTSTITLSGGTLNICAHTGTGNGSPDDKFDMLSGTLNLTGGTLNLKGNSDNSSYDAFEIGSGVTTNITSGCTVVCTGNGSNDENMYLDLDGNSLNNLTVNLTGYKVINRDNLSIATLTVSNGTFDVGTSTVTASGTTDINGTLSGTGTFIANGNFDATGGTVSLIGSGTLQLSSTITSLGTLSTSAGTVVYNGSSAQSIDQAETFYGLQLNNPDGLTLNSSVTVNGTLTLGNGDIISSPSNSITIKSSASGGSASGHINGPCFLSTSAVASSPIEVPVGDGTIYRPVFLKPSTTAATSYNVEFYNQDHSSTNWANHPNGAPIDESSGLNHIAIGYWWNISRSFNGSPAWVGVNWDAAMGVDSPNDMLLAHYNGSDWESVGGTMTGSNGTGSATNSDGRVTSGWATNDFSPFGPGDNGNGGNPFPIDLLSFTATCSHDLVDVNFTLNSQINNDYFIIERSSDAIEWEAIEVIDGAGNSNAIMEYSFIDTDPLSGLAYYRLTQVDYDGVFETFYPVSSSCGSEVEGLPILVYPNPIIDEFTIEVELENYQGNDVYYMILDVKGSIVMREQIELNRGFNKHVIDVKSLTFGSYVLRFVNTKDQISEKHIVIK